MKPIKLYIIVLIACSAGYIWLFFQSSIPSENIGYCLIKQSTGIPCPSCGTTRSILSIKQGDLHQAVLWNPLGFVSLLIMLVSPIWILFDLSLKKQTFYKTFRSIENQLNKPQLYIPVILLVLLNWIWNIFKGL